MSSESRQLSTEHCFHPCFNRFAHFAQAAFEEVIGSFDDHQFLGIGNGSDQTVQLGSRTELVAGTADKQLGLCAFLEELIRVDARFFRIRSDGSNGNS